MHKLYPASLVTYGPAVKAWKRHGRDRQSRVSLQIFPDDLSAVIVDSDMRGDGQPSQSGQLAHSQPSTVQTALWIGVSKRAWLTQSERSRCQWRRAAAGSVGADQRQRRDAASHLALLHL